MIIGANFKPGGNSYLADLSSLYRYDTFYLLENVWNADSDSPFINNHAKMFDAVFRTYTANSLRELMEAPTT